LPKSSVVFDDFDGDSAISGLFLTKSSVNNVSAGLLLPFNHVNLGNFGKNFGKIIEFFRLMQKHIV